MIFPSSTPTLEGIVLTCQLSPPLLGCNHLWNLRNLRFISLLRF
jgi:hypothetical protein